MDCDAFKFYGLSYTIKEIVKLDPIEFNILKGQAANFMRHYNLSHLLYHHNIDKAIKSTFKDPNDESLYHNFLQGIRRNASRTNNKLKLTILAHTT